MLCCCRSSLSAKPVMEIQNRFENQSLEKSLKNGNKTRKAPTSYRYYVPEKHRYFRPKILNAEQTQSEQS